MYAVSLMTTADSGKYKLLINGSLVDGFGDCFHVADPSTRCPVASVPQASPGQVAEAVDVAFLAFKTWSTLPMLQRKKYLLDARELLLPHIDELALLLTTEQGKPVAHARSEIESAIQVFQDAQAVPESTPQVIRTTATHSLEIHRKPIGVVAGIVPWNYPAYIALMKVAQALVFGNTIVLKPSPNTPLTTLRIGEILANAFPAGVLNIVAGRDTRDQNCVGELLTKNPKVALVSFTGSIATGKRVFKNSAERMGRLILELGGNDPAIVLQDADVEQTARGVLEGGLINSGQICCGIKRVFVHSSIYDEFVEKIAEMAKAKAKEVGPGLDPHTTLGPINNETQFKRVVELVNDAVARGAIIHAGGKLPAHTNPKGFFYEPSIVTGVAEGVRLVDEEQFGPVIPIMPFSTEDEVVQRANNTQYGLGASVWGTDPIAVNRIATQLEAGIVWTNEHATDNPNFPFGGMKQSGIGREGDWGEFDVATYTEPQSIKLLR